MTSYIRSNITAARLLGCMQPLSRGLIAHIRPLSTKRTIEINDDLDELRFRPAIRTINSLKSLSEDQYGHMLGLLKTLSEHLVAAYSLPEEEKIWLVLPPGKSLSKLKIQEIVKNTKMMQEIKSSRCVSVPSNCVVLDIYCLPWLYNEYVVSK